MLLKIEYNFTTIILYIQSEMLSTETEKKLKWLLKDKYNYSELEIRQTITNYFQDKKSISNVVLKDCKRVEAAEPLAYIIGWVLFNDCKIFVNKNVLIPRPETEFWVSEELNKIPKDFNGKILDLCCGSGCIGISILKKFPNCTIDFVDLSEVALKQTKLNLEKNKISEDRFKIIKSNLFENLHDKYEYIFTNPPYVSSSFCNPDLEWEPKMALYSGETGINHIIKIINSSPFYLESSGKVFIEIGEDQEKLLREDLKKLKITDFEFKKDQYGKVRTLCLL